MRRSQKSKGIYWAPDVSLCQVRLFLSEDSPSQVGLGSQDHLQAKSSLHSSGASDDTLPPGFGGGHSSNESQIKLSDIPVIKWKYPIKFLLILEWRVVSGEESKEIEIENQREMRVLEAFYPCASAIPPNPSVSADVETSHYNDYQTPVIPITAIEDEDMAAELPYDFVPQFLAPVSLQPSVTSAASEKSPALDVDPDIVAAALNAIAKTNDNGSIIDQDLLIKILSNPNLVENLITNHGPATTETPKPASNYIPSTSHTPALVTSSEPSRPYPVASVSTGQFYPQPNETNAPPGFAPSPQSVGLSQSKDVNYYKNLIQQHGGDRQELPQPQAPPQQFNLRYGHQGGPNQEPTNGQRPKQRIMKPCIYFNSSRGCRHGSKCAFQHDASSQQRSSNHNNHYNGNAVPEMQSTKRMKLDREISS